MTSDTAVNYVITEKRQAAREAREARLLELAERIMQRDGFSGLTMDKLVSACDYSKGTVYNHFNSKEDLLCALCIKGMRLTLDLFQQAAEFEGNSREKILAIHFAYHLHALACPTLFLCVLTSQTPAVREKADPQRLALQQALDTEMTQHCDAMFEMARRAGDVPASQQVQSMTFASWAMAFGSNALMTLAAEVQGVQRMAGSEVLLTNVNLLMDGMQWQPLSRDFDYAATWHRIGETLFAAEIRQLSDAQRAGLLSGQLT